MFTLLLILIFIRPFISSLAFSAANGIYSFLLIITLLILIIKIKSPSEKVSKLYPSILLFMFSLLVAFTFSFDKIKSSAELYKYLSGVLLLLVVPGLSEKNRKLLILSILICAMSISVLAHYQYFFGFANLERFVLKENINTAFISDRLLQKRVFYPFVSPDVLAGYLAMVIPLALIYKRRALLLIPLVSALILTKSIGGLIALLAGTIVYIYLKGSSKKTKIISFSGLGLSIALIFILRIASLKAHLAPFFSVTMRINYWRDTLEIIKTHPFVGSGLGNFNLIYSRYAHNSYLQFWAEAGLFGLAALLWLIYSILKVNSYRIKNSVNKKEVVVLIPALAVFLFHNLWDFGFFLPEVTLIWWTLAGLLVSFAVHGIQSFSAKI